MLLVAVMSDCFARLHKLICVGRLCNSIILYFMNVFQGSTICVCVCDLIEDSKIFAKDDVLRYCANKLYAN